MSSMLQVRNVPDEVIARLKTDAAAQRLSLSDYVLEHLIDLASLPQLDDVLLRLKERPRRDLGVDGATLVHEARAE